MLEAGERGCEIAELALFVPSGLVAFQAHPLPLIERQAEALRLPLRIITIEEPYRESYVRAFAEMSHIDAVVTGDIDLVDGHPNWVRECAREAGDRLKVLTPLWGCDRLDLLHRLVDRGVEACLSHIAHDAIPPGWLGRMIDEALIAELQALQLSHGIDPCGENGEYHSMVESCPGFAFRVAAAFGGKQDVGGRE